MGRATACLNCASTGEGISIHALRGESDAGPARLIDLLGISIHALREEGDLAILRIAAQHPISIHALREEGDASPSWCWPSRANFNPRPPRGGRHSTQRLKLASSLFQSTPSARRTTEKAAQAKQDTEISIHALRGESDLLWNHFQNLMGQFQSTPSAGRATAGPPMPFPCRSDFNPRPPRGERHRACRGQAACRSISIHALREESDGRRVQHTGATSISIHALREEGDEVINEAYSGGGLFQSTPSARRATTDTHDGIISIRFQSTPSARRATRCVAASDCKRRNFNPRPPRGGRQTYCLRSLSPEQISIHALREEGDFAAFVVELCDFISIHALREEGDPMRGGIRL